MRGGQVPLLADAAGHRFTRGVPWQHAEVSLRDFD